MASLWLGGADQRAHAPRARPPTRLRAWRRHRRQPAARPARPGAPASTRGARRGSAPYWSTTTSSGKPGGREQACIVDEAGKGSGYRVHGRQTSRFRLAPPKPEGRRRGNIGGCVGCVVVLIACLVPLVARCANPSSPSRAARQSRRPLFTTPLTPAEMKGKQAVVETPRAPSSSSCCRKSRPITSATSSQQARQGAYDSTTFHSALRMGLIQGGDPLSKDPAKRALYGTGGLGMLAQEFNARAGDARRGRRRAAARQARQRRQPVLHRRHRPGRAQRHGHGVRPRRRGPRGGAGDLRGAGGRAGEGDRADRDDSRSPSATRRRRSRCRFPPRPSRISPSTAR